MFELSIRFDREDMTGALRTMPEPFLLAGYGSPYVIAARGWPQPLLIDAEGVVLGSGAVYVWCRSGCCPEQPRRWPSMRSAAEYHGSIAIGPNGTVRTFEDADDE